MSEDKPAAPELPEYLVSPVDRQDPEQLEVLAEYASRLATWKRDQREAEAEERREEEAIGEEEREELRERDVSTDPSDYENVPSSSAYITVKTTKQTAERSYDYYYWQWRDGDTWKNEYIAPVNPRTDDS